MPATVLLNSPATQAVDVEILHYTPELKPYFKSLNVVWIEKHFSVEPEDIRVLENPDTVIIAEGGQVFFARYDNQIVGTCALIRHGDAFELAKMAVDETYRGKQIGRKLLLAAITYAKNAGVKAVELETNSSLKPAISLYESVGFIHKPVSPDTKFARADVAMHLAFN